jgi:hypothetical protein
VGGSASTAFTAAVSSTLATVQPDSPGSLSAYILSVLVFDIFKGPKGNVWPASL